MTLTKKINRRAVTQDGEYKDDKPHGQYGFFAVADPKLAERACWSVDERRLGPMKETQQDKKRSDRDTQLSHFVLFDLFFFLLFFRFYVILFPGLFVDFFAPLVVPRQIQPGFLQFSLF